MPTSGGYGSNSHVSGIKSPFFKSILNLFYPPMPTLNIISKKERNLIKKRVFNGEDILNIGSGGLGGCGKWLWENNTLVNKNIYNLDIQVGSLVNVCGDAHILPFKDNVFDSIILQAVLEHVVDPKVVMKESLRVLKPGGVVYIEVPFLQGFHADPHDYQRYTMKGLEILTSESKRITSGVSVGPFCTFVWIVRDGFSSCFKNKFLYLSSRFLLAWVLSPIRYLDHFSKNSISAEKLANEYYFLSEK